MILVAILVALIILFIILRHHVGIPFLAMIAGVAVNEAFGDTFASTISTWVPVLDKHITQQILYGIFIVVIPLVLYFRVGKSGLFGIIRIGESILFALMLTLLISGIVAEYCSFDALSGQLVGWIENVRGIVMMAGTLVAYVDVFLFHSGRLHY